MDMADVKRKLIETLRAFDTLMVATDAQNGTIHARPMAVAEVDDNGEVWFVTQAASDKVDEVKMSSRAVVTGQDAHRYVSLSGQLDVIHDRERIVALWKNEWSVWFTEGQGGRILLRLRPEIGEYWLEDRLKGVGYVFVATRAMLDGVMPKDVAVHHAKIAM